jgi:hypothetical protein
MRDPVHCCPALETNPHRTEWSALLASNRGVAGKASDSNRDSDRTSRFYDVWDTVDLHFDAIMHEKTPLLALALTP